MLTRARLWPVISDARRLLARAIVVPIAPWILGPWMLSACVDADRTKESGTGGGDPVETRTLSPGAGRWRKAPATPGPDELANLSEEDRRTVSQLEAIGYMAGSTAAPALRGVTVHDRERAWRGLNFMTSGHAPAAILMDMNGRVIHEWRAEFAELFPGRDVEAHHPGRAFWRRAALRPNGDILVIFEGLGIARLDAESKPIWTADVRAHHDLEIMPGEQVYVLTRTVSVREDLHEGKPFLEDFIVVLDAGGAEIRRVSVFDALLDSDYAALYKQRRNAFGDVFHTNTLEVLDGRIASAAPAFAAGNILVAMPMLNATAVVDLDDERVVWAHTGAYRLHHDPKMLDNGHLLIFDNVGASGRSRVLELDPGTDEIVWAYTGTEERPFQSDTCGTAQRLGNGNTLITESDGGRAFEVTSEGEIVWQYYNPHRAGDDDELIATLFEVVRLPPDFPIDWAAGEGTRPGDGSE